MNTVAAWKDAVLAAADAANGDAAVPAEYAENPAAYVATFDAATARKFTDELTKHIPVGEQGTAAVNGVITATEGWFLVTSTTEKKAGKSALVATQITSGGEAYTKITLNAEDGQHNIDALGRFNAKDENVPTPPTKTADGKGTVNVGDTVNYTITAVVPPAAAGYDTYKYTITDAASKGLNVAEDDADFVVVVKEGNARRHRQDPGRGHRLHADPGRFRLRRERHRDDHRVPEREGLRRQDHPGDLQGRRDL